MATVYLKKLHQALDLNGHLEPPMWWAIEYGLKMHL